jgi:Raf kinase inhibitor-like YbhB/YbcL family protein
MRIGAAVCVLGVLLAGGARADGLSLSSPDLADGASIPAKYVYKGFGCTGGNVSPALQWSGAPAGTKSYALTVYDPDAPTGSGWWHWVVVNLPPTASGLHEGAGNPKAHLAPPGTIQSRTDFGTPGYGGPCPPPGAPHHYIFTIFALDVAALPIKTDTPAAQVGFNLHFHTIAKASFTALYGH